MGRRRGHDPCDAVQPPPPPPPPLPRGWVSAGCGGVIPNTLPSSLALLLPSSGALAPSSCTILPSPRPQASPRQRVDFWNEKREIKTLRLRLRGKRESEGENLCSRGIMWLWSHRDLCRAREWKGTTWWVGLGLAGHACVRTLGRGAFIIDNCSRKGGTDVPEHRASEKSLSLLCVWYFAREGRSFRAHLI